MNVRARIAAWVVDQIVDRGLLGDVALRRVMRRMLRRRHRSITGGGVEQRMARKRALIARLRESDVAIDTDAANEQHYEVPTELFERMLGPRLKYSCALWDEGTDDLAAAEDAMLELTCQRAELADGLDVLELGCGWGSLTLWMAERFPRSRITAVSNSSTQRAFIVERARELGLDNITVVTCDVNDLGRDDDRLASLGGVPVVGPERFDRVVSVEMFEHVRNHTELTSRIATWLRPGGKLFVHVFAHRSDPYPFEAGGSGDWMARHFFTG
ncbi:MAG: class I SAM-dependent methyltransferase, partial [Nitriliruptoraceae bacterium]